MTQVEDSISEFENLDKEQALQLGNFVDLLMEMAIIAPPDTDFFQTPQTEPIKKDLIEESELLICEAYLESSLVDDLDIPSVNFTDIYYGSENISNYAEVKTIYEASINSGKIDKKLDNTSSICLENSPDSIAAFEKLQNILVGAELTELNNLAANMQENLAKLEHQIYDPQELINLLVPSISEVLRLKISESKEEIAQIIAPIVDQAIMSRTRQDKGSMSHAIAPAIPMAISQQIITSPDEVSDAFAPTMGRAIKKQIQLEENVIIDALYPIIGSTISKYLAETIRVINQQVEDTLSVKGIKRKISAKLQGVSEAELILKEALPFNIQAIFLIHKESGLIISDIQPQDEQRLESEMIAGMLTAIRSFANDCIQKYGNISELDAIDYGTSKITLEVAGYCYLAIVIQGEATKGFTEKIRDTLGKIVKDYGDSIEKFDGDLDSIPSQIHTMLSVLKDEITTTKDSKNKPSPLVLLSLSLISAIFIPWGIWQYHNGNIHSVENKATLALASTPELSVYRLTVEAEKGKLKLIGRVPNEFLKNKAEKIVQIVIPKWSINNQIIPVEIPADPILADAEVKRITEVLNQMDGVLISTQYTDDKVTIEGTVGRNTDLRIINDAFEQIPGVRLVSSAVKIQPLQINVRFYFDSSSANIQSKDLNSKVGQVKVFLDQQPKKHLKIIGYSNSTGNSTGSQQLALARAKVVKQALITQGVEPTRLEVFAATTLPPGIGITQPEWLKRCVSLEVRDN
jgi:outer membrane protein OmpA-like peptidoglycan-associated protein